MSQSINIEIKIEFEMKIWCFSNKIRFNFKNFQISESELIQILKLKSIINVKKTLKKFDLNLIFIVYFRTLFIIKNCKKPLYSNDNGILKSRTEKVKKLD
jgi:hypothetical protein